MYTMRAAANVIRFHKMSKKYKYYRRTVKWSRGFLLLEIHKTDCSFTQKSERSHIKEHSSNGGLD